MTQKWHQKASVQTAIVTSIGAIVVAVIYVGHQRSQLKGQNDELSAKVVEQTAEIQELQTILVPFRTIALEKFTGNEKEALRKLAKYVVELQRKDAEQIKQIGDLQDQLKTVQKRVAPRSISATQARAFVEKLSAAQKAEIAMIAVRTLDDCSSLQVGGRRYAAAVRGMRLMEKGFNSLSGSFVCGNYAVTEDREEFRFQQP